MREGFQVPGLSLVGVIGTGPMMQMTLFGRYLEKAKVQNVVTAKAVATCYIRQQADTTN